MSKRQAKPTTPASSEAPQFWFFSTRQERHAWIVRPQEREWGWSTSDLLNECKSIQTEWPRAVPLFTFEKAPVFYDTPMEVNSIPIVSERLRQFMENEAGGHLEFLPIEFAGPKQDEIPEDYYILNFTSYLDVLDLKKSKFVSQGTGWGKELAKHVFDPAKVAASAPIGRLKEDRTQIIVRDDLRLRLKKAKFTGFWFDGPLGSDQSIF